MLQRIQSIYLLLAAIASVACLMMPVGHYMLNGTEQVATVFNLWLTLAVGGHSFVVWPLMAVLTLQSVLTLYAIFMYGNRIAQARMCAFGMLMVVGWYVIYAVEALAIGCGVAEATFSPSWQAALPVASLVLTFLARRAILADERLVRAADRIR